MAQRVLLVRHGNEPADDRVATRLSALRYELDLRKPLNLVILVITHALQVAAQISDEIIVMKKGGIVQRGRAYDVLTCRQCHFPQSLIADAPDQGEFQGVIAAY